MLLSWHEPTLIVKIYESATPVLGKAERTQPYGGVLISNFILSDKGAINIVTCDDVDQSVL